MDMFPYLKKIFFVCLSMISFAGLAQKHQNFQTQRDSVAFVLNLLRENGEVQSYSISLGDLSKQFCGFIYLVKNLDKEALYKLTKDKSACVRIYAYTALIHFEDNRTSTIREELGCEDGIISVMYGCVKSKLMISKAIEEISSWYDKDMVEEILIDKDHTLKYYLNFLFEN